MTKQFKVGDVVEVVGTKGHSAKLGSIGIVREVLEDSSVMLRVYEKEWEFIYSQVVDNEELKLLTRVGDVKEISGNDNRPRHFFPKGTVVEVLGVRDNLTLEDFKEKGMLVLTKLPASEGTLEQIVNVYDLTDVEVEDSKDPQDNTKASCKLDNYQVEEDEIILFLDGSDCLQLGTFGCYEEDGMFSVDTQPSDMWDGIVAVPDSRFFDTLGFSLGDTVMFTGENNPSTHQLEKGDVVKVVDIDSDGDLVLDTSGLEHVTQDLQYLWGKECLKLELVDKTSVEEDYETEEETEENKYEDKGVDNMVKIKVGDKVKITDDKTMNVSVVVGDTAEVLSTEEPFGLIRVKMTSGKLEGEEQLADDWQLEVIDDAMKVGFNKGDVVEVVKTIYFSPSVSKGDLATVEGVDDDGHYVLKFEREDGNALRQYADDEDIRLHTPEKAEEEEKSEEEILAVGDIVKIVSSVPFNDVVKEGDLAEVIRIVESSNVYKMVMLTGDYKGKEQMCYFSLASDLLSKVTDAPTYEHSVSSDLNPPYSTLSEQVVEETEEEEYDSGQFARRHVFPQSFELGDTVVVVNDGSFFGVGVGDVGKVTGVSEKFIDVDFFDGKFHQSALIDETTPRIIKVKGL